nr:LOW QUALITY PROTEIN: uncharacterized protein LOC108069095 [Drosophila takahashii]
MISHTNSYTILAFLSTIAWIFTVVGLFVGLLKGRPTLLVFWLLFSGFATSTDIIFLIWNVTSSPVFDVHHFKLWTISYWEFFMSALACTWYSDISEDYIPIVFWKATTMIGHLKKHRRR